MRTDPGNSLIRAAKVKDFGTGFLMVSAANLFAVSVLGLRFKRIETSKSTAIR